MKSLTIMCALALPILAPVIGEAQNVPTVREACAADAAKLCGDAQDLQTRTQCMIGHKDELSDGCKAARAARQGGEHVGGASVLSAPAPAAGTAHDGGLDSVASRIAGHGFPSIFAPWNIAQALRPSADAPPVPLSANETDTVARHDLYFAEWQKLGLKLADNQKYAILTPEFTPESVETARRNRAALLALNPDMLILVSVHYNAATPNFLPPDSPFWRRDDVKSRFNANNQEYGSYRLDFPNPAFQDKVAALCAALVQTGVYDGCMFDGWHDDQDSAGRLSLIRKTRAAIGDKAIIIGNVNQRLPTETAPYLNGMYMEGYGAHFFPDWHMAAANLLWGESHLRKPVITALEGWYQCATPQCLGDPARIQQQGRGDYAGMRAVTTLSLVFSNGSVVFSDPNPLPTPDHLHDWYPFWDKSLGRPVGPVADLDRSDLSGAYTRQFEKGEAVFNPPSNHAVTVNFHEPRRSAATNVIGSSFIVAPGDGDLFLDPEQKTLRTKD